MGLEQQLLETWTIHNRVNIYLLDALAPEALRGVPTSKGRSVGDIFAHLHNVRLMWLKSTAPSLLADLVKIERAEASDQEVLHRSLTASGAAVGALLERALASDGRVKGFKPHAVAFLGYLIAHEAHHRGEIELTLTQAGHKLDQKVSYGLWEWGVR